jgi:hypothetical protein
MKKGIFLIIVFGIGLLFQTLSAQTWSDTKRLTWNPSDSDRPSIASDSIKNIYIVWRDYSSGNSEIYFKKSTDGGTSWLKKRLSWNSGVSIYPDISTDSGKGLHVVWEDSSSGSYEIHYKKSTNRGTSWTSKQLTSGSTGCGAMLPSITTDTNDNIHVVWYSDTSGNMEVYYMKSTNAGSTWTTKRLTWNAGESRTPAIATDTNNRIYIVWYDDTPGNSEIFLKKSTDEGKTWTTQRLTWTSDASATPSIAVDSNNFIHIVWHDYTPGNWDIYYKKSTNGGTSWTSKRLTWNLSDSEWPKVTTDSNNNIHVVWDEESPGNNEVFYKRSTNGGMNWTMKRLTWNSGASEFPKIICDPVNLIYVTWYDSTPGNREIFYKKGQQ